MALIKYKECGHEVSSKASVCPKCGCTASECEKIENGNSNVHVCRQGLGNFNEKPHYQRNRKGIVAVVYGLLVIFAVVFFAIAGGFYLWQNMANEKYKSQKNPVYSEELVKIAAKGNAVAQYDLGRCYANDYGISQDYAEDVQWYRKAAEQGHAKAIQALKEIGNEYK